MHLFLWAFLVLPNIPDGTLPKVPGFDPRKTLTLRLILLVGRIIDLKLVPLETVDLDVIGDVGHVG